MPLPLQELPAGCLEVRARSVVDGHGAGALKQAAHVFMQKDAGEHVNRRVAGISEDNEDLVFNAKTDLTLSLRDNSL